MLKEQSAQLVKKQSALEADLGGLDLDLQTLERRLAESEMALRNLETRLRESDAALRNSQISLNDMASSLENAKDLWTSWRADQEREMRNLRKENVLLWILTSIGAVVAVAGLLAH